MESYLPWPETNDEVALLLAVVQDRLNIEHHVKAVKICQDTGYVKQLHLHVHHLPLPVSGTIAMSRIAGLFAGLMVHPPHFGS